MTRNFVNDIVNAAKTILFVQLYAEEVSLCGRFAQEINWKVVKRIATKAPYVTSVYSIFYLLNNRKRFIAIVCQII